MTFLKDFIFLACLSASVMAHAGGSAQVVCDQGGISSMFAKRYPVLEVTYTTGADAGTPGLLWIGVLTPDKEGGAFSTPNGWIPYKGGLYPFHARYDKGLPSTATVRIPFPGRDYSTVNYIGYTVYTGHGVYTQMMQEQVRERREVVDSTRTEMVEKGLWRAEFDSDEYYMQALVQQDLTINKKYGLVYTIPYIDCNPDQGGA